jgi:quercetin dioxygenase-like cupin family protein
VKRTRVFAIAGVTAVCGAGAAFAAHEPQVDPAHVPIGFLTVHNKVDGIRLSSLARAVDRGKADVFVQHIRLAPGAATPWHTHPGAVFVQVAKGTLNYEAEAHGECKPRPYQAGEGFFDRGFGHVHRAVAGADGADFYAVFVLRPGSANQLITAAAPEECLEEGDVAGDTDESDEHADDEREHPGDD